ncbi:hypothetical protein [Streptomyces rishiriensis]|uniref:Uncharacterized protein n=1 Tax=Streptomyces rishiriensis TaxID=68264 RepID=A0ABU0P2R5_STRRH|nr:hypothetical protein [Streptomyces rishiriensis]MDQ0585692.1 hypothetical protein [Streptomyces rishiriensis]
MRVKVKAFGVNEPEVTTQRGELGPGPGREGLPQLEQVRDAQTDVGAGTTPGTHMVTLDD